MNFALLRTNTRHIVVRRNVLSYKPKIFYTSIKIPRQLTPHKMYAKSTTLDHLES